MANTTSAKKATRKIARRTEINRSRRSEMRTYVKKVEEALSKGDAAAATAANSTRYTTCGGSLMRVGMTDPGFAARGAAGTTPRGAAGGSGSGRNAVLQR